MDISTSICAVIFSCRVSTRIFTCWHVVSLETFRISQHPDQVTIRQQTAISAVLLITDNRWLMADIMKVRLLRLNKFAGVLEDVFLRAAHEFADRIDDLFLQVKQDIFLAHHSVICQV